MLYHFGSIVLLLHCYILKIILSLIVMLLFCYSMVVMLLYGYNLIVMLLYGYSLIVMLLYRYSLIDQSRGGCGIEALTGVHYGSVTTGVVGTYRWQYKCSGNDLLLAKHVALTGSTGWVWLLICQQQLYDHTVCFEIPLVNLLARLWALR